MADRGTSPVSQETGSSPTSSPTHEDAPEGTPVESRSKKTNRIKKKGKRKAAESAASAVMAGGDDGGGDPGINRKAKKAKKKHKQQEKAEKEAKGGGDKDDGRSKKPRKKNSTAKGPSTNTEDMSAAQKLANEQMRRVLEEDQYSANGSIVETDSDSEDNFTYRGEAVRMDRAALMAAMRKHLWMEKMSAAPVGITAKPGEEDEDDNDTRRGGRKKKKKGKRGKDGDDRIAGSANDEPAIETSRTADAIVNPLVTANGDVADDYDDRDGGSVFGPTTGSSNATWVECDKCKKWRRLRGVVDEKKLPSRWYCSMNKNDPERARCSAPEEEYETPHTPESAADARTRKHLRVWVRRLQCNEAYESRQPTLTRGRKRATASTTKEPYEWVRCCNQSCGKWRAILRCMDAKTSVIERTSDGEWYCVQNTWDEKMASCAAPQENLPAIACPAWVTQDEK